MKCLNCGSIVNQGELYCRTCGAKIILQQDTYLQSANGTEMTRTCNSNDIEIIDLTSNNDIEIIQSVNNNNAEVKIDNDILINAYIGKNANKLRKGGFSYSTLIFGIVYVLYRKMWLLGLIWFVGSVIVSLFLSSIASILTSAISLVISTNFKKWYLQHVEEKVQKIKDENPNATQEQLIMICSKKGGTTIWPVIGIIILNAIIFFIVFMFILILIEDTKKNNENMNNNYEYGEVDNNISFISNDILI